MNKRSIWELIVRMGADIRLAFLVLALASAYSLTTPGAIRAEEECGPGFETLPVGECEDCEARQGGYGGWLCPIGCCYKEQGEEEFRTCLYHPQQEPCGSGGY